MSKQLFRQKSLEKITSPEQMGDYIRVSNPSVWMILVAIIVLLIGVCVWGVFGRLDTTLPTGGVCKDGQLTLYISEKDFDKLGADTLVSVNEKEYALSEISESPVKLDTSYDPYLIPLLSRYKQQKIANFFERKKTAVLSDIFTKHDGLILAYYLFLNTILCTIYQNR